MRGNERERDEKWGKGNLKKGNKQWRKVTGEKVQSSRRSLKTLPVIYVNCSPSHIAIRQTALGNEQHSAFRTGMYDLSTNDCYKYDISLIGAWFKRVSIEQMLGEQFYISHRSREWLWKPFSENDLYLPHLWRKVRLMKTVLAHKSKQAP